MGVGLVEGMHWMTKGISVLLQILLGGSRSNFQIINWHFDWLLAEFIFLSFLLIQQLFLESGFALS